MTIYPYNYSIICVDDEKEILNAYQSILSGNDETSGQIKDVLAHRRQRKEQKPDAETKNLKIPYKLFLAASGEEAVEIVTKEMKAGNRIAAGFFDMVMPGMDGAKTIKRILELDDQMLCAIVTAYTDRAHEQLSTLFKRHDDWLFFNKPFSSVELQQAAHHLVAEWNQRRNEELLIKTREDEKILEQQKINSAAIRSLASLAELRDTDTGTHLKRVAEYCRLIASELAKLDSPKWCNYITEKYINDIVESSVLHDIGKVGIPDSILLKPGQLSAEEFDIMKSHSRIGGEVLAKAVNDLGTQSFLTLGREIAYYHHEKYNGTGYPDGLIGENIPLSARILALADVYDALTSDRPYRKALPHEKAMEIIVKEMGNAHFDPVILDIFQKNEKKFDEIRRSIAN